MRWTPVRPSDLPSSTAASATMSMFSDSPEYRERLAKPFIPPTITLKEIHDAVPKHLLKRDPLLSSYYIARDIAMCVGMFVFGSYIDPLATTGLYGLIPNVTGWQVAALKTGLWLWYWWWQGLVFMSFFCISHELGHQSLFDHKLANDVPGFILDTFIMLPYFAWKASHNAHHKAVGIMERDENYVPHERKEYKLPPPERATRADYAELFEETPALTLFRIFIMQAFGWWLYLGFNTMGAKFYPEGTNHFSPYSPLFKPEQRRGIIINDIGLTVMSTLLFKFTRAYGVSAFFAYYFVPWVLCNHWIVACTFLHHSDPSLPHYRKGEWTFLRGVLATADRPILGWMGSFFFHNVSHYHIAHHFFSTTPFYRQIPITNALRKVLKDEYNYDTTNVFYALYRSFVGCTFVDDEGDVIFYRNTKGELSRQLADEYVKAKKTPVDAEAEAALVEKLKID